MKAKGTPAGATGASLEKPFGGPAFGKVREPILPRASLRSGAMLAEAAAGAEWTGAISHDDPDGMAR